MFTGTLSQAPPVAIRRSLKHLKSVSVIETVEQFEVVPWRSLKGGVVSLHP